MVKTILIVDDDPSVIHTVKYGLEGLGANYKVISVDCGEKCLEMLRHTLIPDLILLDIMMPGMSGWETHRKIKENNSWRNIPIVFLTALTDQASREAGFFYGEGYIEKPFKIPELKQRIDAILEQ